MNRPKGPWLLIPALLFCFALQVPVSSQSSSGSAVVFAPTGDKRIIHQALIGEIKKARKSIDVAIFNFTSRALAKALKEKSKQVRVRILFDERSAKKISISQHKDLIAFGVPSKLVRLPGSGVRAAKFHHKFCVIDGKEVITGSYNWTVGADTQNYENLVVLNDKKLARKFSKEFERIWKDESISKKP